MSFQILQERLTALQNTTKQVEDLINRLGNLKFQPGSIPLDDEDGDVSAELSGEIHQTLKEQAEDLELLDQEIQDLSTGRPGSDRERDKDYLDSIVGRASSELKLARISFRKAQLSAKHNLDVAQRAERSLLLSTLSSLADPTSSTESLPLPRRKTLSSSLELSKDEKIVNASSDVTAALRRTHQLMQTELSRSQFAHDTLKESTAALAQLGESYSALDTLLSSSRNLLGTLLRSQKSDTWYLETAFYILVATIVWLVFRRFVYGPAWWLIWLPLKIFYKAWMGVFTAVGLRSSRDGVLTSESMAGTTIISQSPTMAMHSSAIGIVSSCSATGKNPSNAPPREVGAGGTNQGSMVDEVGQIIDDIHQDGISNGQRSAQETVQDDADAELGDPEHRNAKKRMWEELVEAKEEERTKDEL